MNTLARVEVLDKANYFALVEGRQIMFFTTRKQGDYLILWCKVEGSKPKYKLSIEGTNYTENNHFNNVSSYLGKTVYITFNKNNLNLWQELYDKQLFPLWDPKEGPFAYNSTNLKRIAICQVFQTNVFIEKYEIGGGQTSRILQNPRKLSSLEKNLNSMIPVVPEQEFFDKKSKIIEIIDKYK